MKAIVKPTTLLGGAALCLSLGLALQGQASAQGAAPAIPNTAAPATAPAATGAAAPAAPAAPAGSAEARLLERGAYVAILGDCAACHTAPGGAPFAGGLPIVSAIGTIYSSNITPDRTHGIGAYSYEDFERAVRRGIRKDGTTLYPAMPYPSYAHVTDDDLHALYAYLQHSIKPAPTPGREADIRWPLSMRWPLAIWRWIFAPEVQVAPPHPSGDAVADRGAYLVQGLGHCGTCHTPRGLALQEKALSPRDGEWYLAGGVVGTNVANNLRGDAVTGLGNWSEDDIVQFLKTGRNVHEAAFGEMSDVVTASTQFMNDADLRAIAHYLKTLPPSPHDRPFTYDPQVAQELDAGKVTRPGALDYLNNCAACHLASGKGYDGTFPALAGNPVVNAPDARSVVNIILSGDTVPATATAPTHFTMPSFAHRLSDQDVANIVTFIRSSWGNHAPGIDAATVAKIRSTIIRPGDYKSP
ncbi:cytochrome c [Acetobacter sp. TBRC 12305]|uniref:Cytochrome c n=1 Tax=Acetobacter garciniae TaxID=2817435 RepID=A0A939HNE1_9PROT|nr:cytochrome c [Acetobacter garciniae]MBO1325461.1 cytochrome c [Acetobacter garciniae]MBX0345367.1 cytochrome c [Acetobacter garciniae]